MIDWVVGWFRKKPAIAAKTHSIDEPSILVEKIDDDSDDKQSVLREILQDLRNLRESEEVSENDFFLAGGSSLLDDILGDLDEKLQDRIDGTKNNNKMS